MDIGIGLPNSVPGTDGQTLVGWAARAEQAGFTTLGTIGRLVYDSYEELVALAAAAAVTSRIRLTTSVLLAPLRPNAALLAKQAASLDRISGGRLTLGLGIGGREDDFRVSGVAMADRGRRLDQQLTVMRRVWAGQERGDGNVVGPRPGRGSSWAAAPRKASGGWPGSPTAGCSVAGPRRCSRRARPLPTGPGRTPGGQGGRASSRWRTSHSAPARASAPARTLATTTRSWAASPTGSLRARR